jgi:hypothetical protein
VVFAIVIGLSFLVVAGEHLSPVASLPGSLGLGNCVGREDLFPGLPELDGFRKVVPVEINVAPDWSIPDLLSGLGIFILERTREPDDYLFEPTNSIFEVIGVENEVGHV